MSWEASSIGCVCNKGARKRPDNGGEEAHLIAVRGKDEIEKPDKTLKYQAYPARFSVGDGFEGFSDPMAELS